MAQYGFRVFNETGGMILDTSTRTGRVAGAHSHVGMTPNAAVDRQRGTMSGDYVAVFIGNAPANSILWYSVIPAFDPANASEGRTEHYTSGQHIFFRTMNKGRTNIFWGWR